MSFLLYVQSIRRNTTCTYSLESELDEDGKFHFHQMQTKEYEDIVKINGKIYTIPIYVSSISLD